MDNGKEIKRMWINQPSTLQAHHFLHGTKVLAQHEYDDTIRIYFLSGNVVHQQVDRSALSDGWPGALLKEALTRKLGEGMDADGKVVAVLAAEPTSLYDVVYIVESPRGRFTTTFLHAAVEYIERFLRLEYFHTNIDLNEDPT